VLVYLDNNPYDHLRAAGLSAPSISARLEAHGHELIISGDNFQEWASCWKSGRPEKERVGRELLRYAFAITPRKLLAGPDQLIPREMAASLGRRLPGPFLPPDDVATAEDLIRRFIDGKATAADRAALLKRWTAKESSVDQAHEVAGRWTQKDTSPSRFTTIGPVLPSGCSPPHLQKGPASFSGGSTDPHCWPPLRSTVS
jgi:hypothetical protein